MDRHRDWWEQAKRDLDKARLDAEYAYWEWACFTAQQAAEKAAKALAMSRGLAVWGHGVLQILRAIEGTDLASEVAADAQTLDAHYITARYPNGFPAGKPADYYNESKAREAIGAAERILEFSANRLP